MVEHASRPHQEFDAQNGFEVLWKSDTAFNANYSLLRVPHAEPVQLTYIRPESLLDFKLQPINDRNDRWLGHGVVDVDTIQNLGMPLTVYRKDTIRPEATEGDVAKWREFGLVDQIEEDLYAVHLIFFPAKVNTFLNNVWRPALTKNGLREKPRFDIDGVNGVDRILPQKISQNARRNLLVQKMEFGS